jgi:serine/threonine protein kinase
VSEVIKPAADHWADGGSIVTNKRDLCMGCMALLDTEGPCSYCGYNNGCEPYNVDYLPPHTELHGRYLVGKLIACNGESACYMGYDLEEDVKVILRELAPLNLVSRNHSSLELKPSKGNETAFKHLAADFEDLCSMLQGMEHISGILPILEVFSENETIYAVFRYVNTLPLGTLITRCGGEILWANCKKMYLQLLNTVSQVHKRGLIHAGISPETILVDEKGNAYLSSFSVNALRYAGSEIDSMLYEGYCAPEQYAGNASFGEWTDVYALSAILYRMLTGTKPPDAKSREQQDNLLPPSELDPSIPQSISDAICDGLSLSIQERTPAVDTLAARLLDSVQTDTAVYQGEGLGQAAVKETEEPEKDEAPLDKKQQRKQEKLEKKMAKRALKRKKKRRALRSFLVILLVTLITSVGLGGFVMFYLSQNYGSIQDSVAHFVSVGDAVSSDAASSASDPTSVPDFIGQYIDTATSNKDYSAYFELSIVHEYNDEYPTGVVFNQSPQEGTRMSNRGTVILYVSKGSETTKLPSLSGSTVDLAIQTLESMELSYKVIYVVNDSYTEGLVAYTSPAADELVKKNDEILIFTKSISESSSSSSSSEESMSASSRPKREESRYQDDW